MIKMKKKKKIQMKSNQKIKKKKNICRLSKKLSK